MDLNSPPPEDAELPGVVNGLIRQSASPSLTERQAAIEGLYELAYKVRCRVASAIPSLVDALLDPDPKLGESALWALHYCSPDSVEPLIDCLAHPQAFVRERSAHSLGNIGEGARSAVPRLLELLTDDDQAVRRRAAWAIGLIRDVKPSTITALFDRVGAGTAEDAAAALHALGNIGQALADAAPLVERQPLILEAMQHEHSDVRWSAMYVAESLRLSPQDHADLLSAVLFRETSNRVREAVLQKLEKLAPSTDLAALLPTLVSLLDKRDREASPACRVLAKMRPAPREAVEPLFRALDDDALVLPAATALWSIEKRVDPLLPALERVFEDYEEEVCDLICTLGPAAAPLLPKVIGALAKEDWDLQWAAADALGAVASEDQKVVSHLLDALGHPSPIVRSASARALAKTGNAAVPQLRSLVVSTSDLRNAWAAFALGEMGPIATAAIPELRAGMRGGEEPLSSSCAIAIALVSGDAETLPFLIKILRSDDARAPRRSAASAIARLGPGARAAQEALEALLADEDYEVVDAAQTALASVRGAPH